jgi:hypothetical protein
MGPEKVAGLVLVLIPTEGREGSEVVPAARIACGAAMDRGLQPLNPVLHFGALRQYDDVIAYRFLKHILWWFKRADRLWVAAADGRKDLDDVPLDPVSYQLLFRNENVLQRGAGFSQRQSGDPMRKQVDMVSWGVGDQVDVRRLDRQELGYMLQTNIVSGLLRGMG